MTVYLDYLYIQNFVFDLVLIIQTKFLSKLPLKISRAIIASIISSAYVCVLVITKQSQLNYFWIKVLLSFLVVYISFKPNSIAKYLKATALFYISSILTLGVSILISQMLCDGKSQNLVTKFAVYLAVLLITYVVTKQFWKVYRFNIKENRLNIPVEMNISGENYIYNAFMDTGNTVYSYELGVPVVFAEYLSLKQKYDVQKLPSAKITVSTISKKSSEKVMLVKGKLKDKYVRFGVVFVDTKLNKDNDYNMILNYKMFEENMGGICI